MTMTFIFKTCIVCGEDVLSMPETRLPMCAQHSDADKRKALIAVMKEAEGLLAAQGWRRR